MSHVVPCGGTANVTSPDVTVISHAVRLPPPLQPDSRRRQPNRLILSEMNTGIFPPPPPCYQPSWTLISQGAEARIWRIPNFYSIQPDSESLTAICKERFKKAYRHESLDRTLTKARTKAEARNLVKCRKAGVNTPTLYSIQLSALSSCLLFMEFIQGITVKQYLEQHVCIIHTNDWMQTGADTSQMLEPSEEVERGVSNPSHRVLVDKHSLRIAHEMGVMIATMHHANIIHGDLTTSNIMIRNAHEQYPCTNNSMQDDQEEDDDDSWIPQLVLIDLGLSTTCSSSYSGIIKMDSKRQENIKMSGRSISGQEDKAVDLYVMERAFQTTHPGSEPLISHLLSTYQQTVDELIGGRKQRVDHRLGHVDTMIHYSRKPFTCLYRSMPFMLHLLRPSA